MSIFWMKAADVYPEGGYEPTDFMGFDPDVRFPPPFPGYMQYQPQVDAEAIGNVRLIPHGPERGLWQWSMTASVPGPRYASPRSGREESRGAAARQLIEVYRHYLETRPESYRR